MSHICLPFQAMSMMGLYDTAYWISWLAWEGLLVIVSSIFIVLFGMMFEFDFFMNNNFAILFLVFCLFQLNMVNDLFLLLISHFQIYYFEIILHRHKSHNTTSLLYVCQTVFAFALSAFISQSSSATNIGFYNFIIGIVTQAGFFNPF